MAVLDPEKEFVAESPYYIRQVRGLYAGYDQDTLDTDFEAKQAVDVTAIDQQTAEEVRALHKEREQLGAEQEPNTGLQRSPYGPQEASKVDQIEFEIQNRRPPLEPGPSFAVYLPESHYTSGEILDPLDLDDYHIKKLPQTSV